MSGEATTPRGWFDFCRSYQPTGPIPAKAGIGCASSTHQAVLDASPGVGVDGSPHRELHARPARRCVILMRLGATRRRVANPGGHVADAALARRLPAVAGLCRMADCAALGWGEAPPAACWRTPERCRCRGNHRSTRFDLVDGLVNV